MLFVKLKYAKKSGALAEDFIWNLRRKQFTTWQRHCRGRNEINLICLLLGFSLKRLGFLVQASQWQWTIEDELVISLSCQQTIEPSPDATLDNKKYLEWLLHDNCADRDYTENLTPFMLERMNRNKLTGLHSLDTVTEYFVWLIQ